MEVSAIIYGDLFYICISESPFLRISYLKGNNWTTFAEYK